jgi:hypothetical protein
MAFSNVSALSSAVFDLKNGSHDGKNCKEKLFC